ncbi:hypothetical protein BJY04DRAFT_217740 [Aspergillus karnatakaensis]|uniref:uncharacterized protein n=1 Tax=Aspergillus karnatakaensis TaxID=1810916 RepID=UPI003CCD5132
MASHVRREKRHAQPPGNTVDLGDPTREPTEFALDSTQEPHKLGHSSVKSQDKHDEIREALSPTPTPAPFAHQTETLSTRINHSRKRSYSLPVRSMNTNSRASTNTGVFLMSLPLLHQSASNLTTATRSLTAPNIETPQHTRSEAVSLLRARTVSRLSEFDRPSLDSVQVQGAMRKDTPPDRKPRVIDRDKASIMDSVTVKKPRKKGKAKMKNRGGDKSTDGNASTEEWFSETSKTESNNAAYSYQNTPVITPRPDDDSYAAIDAVGDAAHKGSGKLPIDNGMWKPWATVAGATWEPTKDLPQPTQTPERSLAQKRLDYARAVREAPSTPVNSALRDPELSTPSPTKQISTDSAAAMEEKSGSVDDRKAQLESADEFPALSASTPKSTWTISSSNTWATRATTPGSEHLDDLSKTEPESIATYHLTPSQEVSTHAHAHPSPPRPLPTAATNTTTINPDIQTPHGHSITTHQPPNFFYQLDSVGFPCSLSSCSSRCNLWDGSSVICPRCGPYSSTRYCSLQHLLADIKLHWLLCGENTFKHPCRKSTIPKSVKESPPLIPSLHRVDSPERQRQAVYFNMCNSWGDYFIFSDWVDILAAGLQDENRNSARFASARCSGQVMHVVRFEDPEERDRFRRVLAVALFVTVESPTLIEYLYRLIRDSLRTTLTPVPPSTSTSTSTSTPPHSQTLTTLLTSLSHQLTHELLQTTHLSTPLHFLESTETRHACPTTWTGHHRLTCTDATCRAEYARTPRLLGAINFGNPGGGVRALVEYLEGSYWVLRAARVSHPDGGDLEGRINGVGFVGVPVVKGEEERRRVWKGLGWEGIEENGKESEKGRRLGEEMEIEGVNW